MEVRDAATGKIEWTGVSEVVDKFQNGLYRANVTTGITAVMLIVAFSIIRLNGDGGSSLYLLIAVFGPVLALIWIIGFIFGYVGKSWIGGYVNPRITQNTNLQPGAVWGPQNLPNLKDMALGSLTVSSSGIAGIILLPWQDVRFVRAKDSQNIELLWQKRFFGLHIGKGRVILNFASPEEAAHFSQAVATHIS